MSSQAVYAIRSSGLFSLWGAVSQWWVKFQRLHRWRCLQRHQRHGTFREVFMGSILSSSSLSQTVKVLRFKISSSCFISSDFTYLLHLLVFSELDREYVGNLTERTADRHLLRTLRCCSALVSAPLWGDFISHCRSKIIGLGGLLIWSTQWEDEWMSGRGSVSRGSRTLCFDSLKH